MWLDLEWRYVEHAQAFGRNGVTSLARQIVREVFRTFESGSIQEVVYRMGMRLLDEIPSVAEVHLEANNRTWLPIAEHGDALGVYAEPPPPYGCIGLRLTR
jgi:urate oxidase